MIAKNFQAGLSPLYTALSGNWSYKIPPYQRPYSWKVDRVEELWDNLIDKYGDDDLLFDDYLLGSIVTVPGNNVHEVVDGQQRLVSLTLMFCALRDHLSVLNEQSHNDDVKFGLKSLISVIHGRICNKQGVIIKLNNNDDDNLFKAICQAENTTIKDLRMSAGRAFRINYDELFCRAEALCRRFDVTNPDTKGINRLQEFFKAVIDHVFVIHITVANIDDAQPIFQVLNSTGQELTQSDLIKNYLMQKKRDLESAWNNAFARFEKSIKKDVKKSDGYIYDSMLSRNFQIKHDKDVSKRNLYRAVKMNVSSAESAQTFIGYLKRDIDIIADLESPKAGNPLLHMLYGFKQINAVYFRRPVIAAVRLWGWDDDRTHNLVDLLLKFFFMYRTVLKMNVDELRSLARDLTKKINDNTNDVQVTDLYKTVLQTIYKKRDNDNLSKFHKRFLDEFIDQEYTTDAVKYILLSIEHELRQELDGPLEKFDVEHVYPQKGEKTWPEYEDLEPYKNNLANLTLLPSKWNRILQNYSFDVKKSGIKDGKPIYLKGRNSIGLDGKKIIVSYNNSKLEINKYFQNCNAWNHARLLERQELLHDYAEKIWDLTKYHNLIKDEADNL